jgi:hypothetical protein
MYLRQSPRYMTVLSGASAIVPVLELAKWMERRGWFGKMA